VREPKTVSAGRHARSAASASLYLTAATKKPSACHTLRQVHGSWPLSPARCAAADRDVELSKSGIMPRRIRILAWSFAGALGVGMLLLGPTAAHATPPSGAHVSGAISTAGHGDMTAALFRGRTGPIIVPPRTCETQTGASR
jgi:hypothetical protein